MLLATGSGTVCILTVVSVHSSLSCKKLITWLGVLRGVFKIPHKQKPIKWVMHAGAIIMLAFAVLLLVYKYSLAQRGCSPAPLNTLISGGPSGIH